MDLIRRTAMATMRSMAATLTKARMGTDYQRFCQVVRDDRRSLEWYRLRRLEAVKHFAGPLWSEETAEKNDHLALVELWVSLVTRSLVSQNPRVLLNTDRRQALAAVMGMEAWMNQQLPRMEFAEILQRMIVDALFCASWVKVGIARASDAAHSGWGLKAGEPFAKVVDLDDMVFDMKAAQWNEIGYAGHRYRCPLEVVRGDQMYSKARKDLTAAEPRDVNSDGDDSIHILGRGVNGQDMEIEDMVELWEFYLPRERKIVIIPSGEDGLPVMDKFDDPLYESRYIGPDDGPYEMVRLGSVVPGNLMPKGPVMSLIPLAESINGMYRKLDRQAANLKKTYAVTGGNEDDAKRNTAARDGDIWFCAGQPPQEIVQGGPDANLMAMATVFKQLFDWRADNLSMMGGLAPQSKTATQDKLLAQSASATIGEKQEKVLTATANICRKLAWYYWHHPTLTMNSRYELPGMPDVWTTRSVRPEQRPPNAFPEISIDPYSLAHQTPAARLQLISQVIKETMPMLPLLQQQGHSFDMSAYLTLIAKYANLPELKRIFTIQEPTEQEPAGQSHGRTMPSETTRSYERINRSEATQAGQEGAQIQAMLGQSNGVLEKAMAMGEGGA